MATTLSVGKKKSKWSTPLLFLSFGLVFLVLFNRDLQLTMGRYAGYVLDPIIGFSGMSPVLTVFLASVILVVATTAIRHFLVDWTTMARAQEAMRAFQGEFKEARKSNNTYKIKKLTDAQPEVMQLQGEVQKEQLKPMAMTMLLVIPLFAWLGTTMSEPAPFELEAAPAAEHAVVLMHRSHVHEGFVASAAREGQNVLNANLDNYGYALRPPGTSPTNGTIRIHNTRAGDDFAIPVDGAPAIPTSALVTTLPAGSYVFTVTPPGENTTLTMTGDYGPYAVDSVFIAFITSGGTQLVDARAVGSADVGVTLAAATDVYVVVPDGQPGGENTGQAQVNVRGGVTDSFIVTPAANVVEIDRSIAAPVYPYNAAVPWGPDAWSLQEPDQWVGILPHWIALYSLFGIPFGQVAQRALKLWEYRHVDLDGDGRRAGEGA